MIHTIYYNAVYPSVGLSKNPYASKGTVDLMDTHAGKNLNLKKYLARKIKASSGDTFVFITTKNQGGDFEAFLTENELKDFIVRDTPQLITNTNYTDHGRKLRLTIMQSKDHPQRNES